MFTIWGSVAMWQCHQKKKCNKFESGKRTHTQCVFTQKWQHILPYRLRLFGVMVRRFKFKFPSEPENFGPIILYLSSLPNRVIMRLKREERESC